MPHAARWRSWHDPSRVQRCLQHFVFENISWREICSVIAPIGADSRRQAGDVARLLGVPMPMGTPKAASHLAHPLAQAGMVPSVG